MTQNLRIERTDQAKFDALADFPYEAHVLEWGDLNIRYVDEGLATRGVALLVHGEPTWSYLYRKMIPLLVESGFRCIAPDWIGFGRSDKVLHDDWYVIERHCESLRHLIDTLDLAGITLVCQDWGGPIGLRQAVDLPDRFDRLVIMNTWLHHDGFEYSDGIRAWRNAATDPALLGGDMPCGTIVAGALQREGHDRQAVTNAYDLPFGSLEAKAGPRRFPWCIPFAQPVEGNAADQQRCFDALLSWKGPINLIWGDADPVFPYGWAESWAAMLPGASLDRIAGAGHFLQEDAGEDVAHAIIGRL